MAADCTRPDSAARSFARESVDGFLERLGSPDPTPGGGAAAAVAGALGAALVGMVAELSVDRPRYARFASTIDASRIGARALRARFLALADEDAAAFDAFMEVARLPRSTGEEREVRAVAVDAAARRAIEPPLGILDASVEMAGLAERLAGRSNLGLASDLIVAAHLAEAAAHSAAANVRVNLPSVADRAAADLLAAEMESVVAATVALARRARLRAGERTLREPETEPLAGVAVPALLPAPPADAGRRSPDPFDGVVPAGAAPLQAPAR